EGGARLLDGCLVGCLLDPKQQVALLDQLSFGEIALLDEAGHPRDKVDLIDRGYPPDVIAGFHYLTAHHRRHGNCRRWRRALRGGEATRRRDAQRANGGFPTEGVTTRHRDSPDCSG